VNFNYQFQKFCHRITSKHTANANKLSIYALPVSY